MEVAAEAFRAYDIRARVGEGFDAEAFAEIGRAIGSEAAARGIHRLAIGRDGRLTSPALMQGLKEGLLASGTDLLDVGCVPTPLLYYAAYTHCDGNGVMVTGSHNPPEYNGIKIMLGGEALHDEAILALYRRVQTSNTICGNGRHEQGEIVADYIDKLTATLSLPRSMKVVVDAGSGVAGSVAPELLRRLGCEVVELNCEVNGHFPNHHPDPNRPENLQQLKTSVLAERADVGIAFDGDGDRLGVVSCRGEIVWPDRLMMLFARDLLRRHPGAEVIYDIKCSRNLGKVIEQAGGRPVMWRTGHSLLKARMHQSGALLAGEMSGHIILAEQWYAFDDALFAAAKLLTLLAADSGGCAAVFERLPDMCNTPELHVKLPGGGDPHAFVQELLVHRDHFGPATLTTIDGLRADFSDGWGLVRASNTTPVLVLRFEAENDAALRRIEQTFGSLMLKLQPELKLPF